MRRIVLTVALLAAPAAQALAQADAPDRGRIEIGLHPTLRNISGIGRTDPRPLGYGITPTIALNFTPTLSFEAGLISGRVWQVGRTATNLDFVTPTASLVMHMGQQKFRPYIVAGVAYEKVSFDRPLVPATIRDIDQVTGNFGLGFKSNLTYNTGLRGEINTQTGQGMPSVGAMLGLSWFPGARRPAPPPPQIITQVRVDTIRLPAPPPRVDTVRVAAPVTEVGGAEIGTVLFDFDRSVIRADARAALQALVPRLTTGDSRMARIRIIGHTDTRGSVAYNLTLGQARARAVRDFLVSNGVSADRIIWASAGEDNPAQTGNTEAAHQANRRAVILRVGGM
jgi:outer membrane protein OmpA-like peptidoglycan-associated protein